MSQINTITGNTLLFTGFFPPCRAATVGSNITLSGLFTLDGVALNAGDRVLVKDQTDGTTNGIYAANSGIWVRTSDALSNTQFFDGMAVVVAGGAQNASTIFLCTTTDDPIIIGTSNLTFANFSAINSISTAMKPVVQALTLALARTAMGLGSAAVEAIGKYGLVDDGAGNLNAVGTTSTFSSHSIVAADNNGFFVASGAGSTINLPLGNTLPNGFRFWVFTPYGASVTVTPNALDTFVNHATGAAISVPGGKLFLFTVDGNSPSSWYVTQPGVWANTAISITSASGVTSAHKGATLQLGGGSFFALTFPAGSTLDADFTCVIENIESGAVGKGVSGVAGGFTLYPGESYLVYNDSGTLKLVGGSVKRYKKASLTLYVDNVNGSNNPTLADGLSTGTRAFASIGYAVQALFTLFDHNGSQPIITIANGTYNESVNIFGMPVGCGNVFFLNGASAGGVTWQPAGAGTPYCILLGDGAIIEYSNILGNGNSISGSLFMQLHQQAIADQNGGCTFGGFPSGSTWATDGSGWTLNINAGYTLNGGATANHFSANSPGIVNHAGGLTVTISGSPNLGFWFRTQSGAIINCGSSITWSGSLTAGCQKWAVQQMSALYCGGNSASIPGSVAGNPATGSAPTATTGWATA